MSSSSGFEISGVGRVAKSYSFGLQYFESAIARIVRGIVAAMMVIMEYLGLEEENGKAW